MRSFLALALVLMGCPKTDTCEDVACVEAKLRAKTCPDGGCVTVTCPARPTAEQCPGGGSSWLRDDATGACCAYACGSGVVNGFTAFATQAQCETRVECNGYAVGAVLQAGDGCNSCTCDGTGQWSCTENNCSSADAGKDCGYFQGPCPEEQYCAFVPVDLCSAGDAPSVCLNRPATCGTDDAPVCGCDAKEYANRCEAARAGTGIINHGACRKNAQCALNSDCAADEFCPLWPGHQFCVKRPLACVNQLDVVCGTDNVQYGNACLAAQAGINVRNVGVCQAHCAGDEDCAANEYCTACAGGTCAPRSSNLVQCTVNAPICGCDGKTYGCAAAAQGHVGIAHTGQCE